MAYADLRGAVFGGNNFGFTYFTGADLTCAYLEETQIDDEKVDFTGATCPDGTVAVGTKCTADQLSRDGCD